MFAYSFSISFSISSKNKIVRLVIKSNAKKGQKLHNQLKRGIDNPRTVIWELSSQSFKKCKMTLFVTLLLIIVNTIFSLCEQSELQLKILDTRIVSLVFQICRSYANWIESQVKAFEKGHENLHENSWKYKGHNNFRAKTDFYQLCICIHWN